MSRAAWEVCIRCLGFLIEGITIAAKSSEKSPFLLDLMLNAFSNVMYRCGISTKKQFAFYMCLCHTNTDLNWAFSEQHLLIFAYILGGSTLTGFISTLGYTCNIYPSSYNINFDMNGCKVLKNLDLET